MRKGNKGVIGEWVVFRGNPDGSDTDLCVFGSEVEAVKYVNEIGFVLDSYGFMCPLDYREIGN